MVSEPLPLSDPLRSRTPADAAIGTGSPVSDEVSTSEHGGGPAFGVSLQRLAAGLHQ